MILRIKSLNDTCRKLVFVVFWSFFCCSSSVAVGIDATLDYEVEGDGFHRTVRYRIDLGNFFQENCHLALHFSPDPTLYVNTDELADLLRRGESTACSEGEIDVELLAENASRQNVTVCRQLKKFDNFMILPLHQRYRLPQQNDPYINVTLPEPALLLGCKDRIKEYGVSAIDLCAPCIDLSLKWRQIPYKTKKEKYVWSVAVGDSADREYVTNGTLLTVILGTLWILRALWSVDNDKGTKKN